MNESGDALLIGLPFGERRERALSPRYHWNNLQRGERFVIIQRTLSGRGVFAWQGETWEVPPEHAFLAVVPEESSYRYPPQAREPWIFSWLNFYGPLAASLVRELRSRHGPVLPLPARSPAGARFATLGKLVQRRSLPDPHDVSIACYGFLAEWSRQLGHQPGRTADAVETVRRICHARFREPIGVKELAAETGLTREHLTRLFAARTGMPPATYLRRLRAEAAGPMLQDGTIPLKEVALRSGFASVRALHRALGPRAPCRRPGQDTGPHKSKSARPAASSAKPQ